MGANFRANPGPYFMASTLAAAVNFPLWKASAIGQSGFTTRAAGGFLDVYMDALKPPYKGVGAVIAGMTWARAAIFWGSDIGRQHLQAQDCPEVVASAAPPLVISTVVQIVNQPIIRASITLQNPQAVEQNVMQVLQKISRERGVGALWHGTSAGILKTVPKYCTAIMIKNYLEYALPHSQSYCGGKDTDLRRSAVKSVTAGVAGAVLTNPLDVIRNEMFKTDQPLLKTVSTLAENEPNFYSRGLGKNIIAVAIPIAFTIFFTDVFEKLV